MTEKVYNEPIDRLTIFKLTSSNISETLKRKLMIEFLINSTFNIEAVFFDIIRPLHSESKQIDIYLAGKFISEIDNTVQLQCVFRKRVWFEKSFFYELDNAVEVDESQLPSVTAILCSSTYSSYISSKLSGDVLDAYNLTIMYSDRVFVYSTNKVHTFVSLKSVKERLSAEQLDIVMENVIAPVEVNNAVRLAIEYDDGSDKMSKESYIYNTLTSE